MKKLITTILITLISLMICNHDEIFQRILLLIENEKTAKFYFKNNNTDSLYVKGVIYHRTYSDIKKIFRKHPQIKILVMEYVPGSIDDEINLQASLFLKNQLIDTYIPKNGIVASGGTDMFLAGKNRRVAPNAKVGIHSWSNGEREGSNFPKSDSEHLKYLSYYEKVGIDSSFYWYTLHVAPASEIHWMSKREMKLYNIINN